MRTISAITFPLNKHRRKSTTSNFPRHIVSSWQWSPSSSHHSTCCCSLIEMVVFQFKNRPHIFLYCLTCPSALWNWMGRSHSFSLVEKLSLRAAEWLRSQDTEIRGRTRKVAQGSLMTLAPIEHFTYSVRTGTATWGH